MNKHACPYCADPAKHGLLPAEIITFERVGNSNGGDYGELREVTSTVHRSIDLYTPVASVRCWNDTYYLQRQELFAREREEKRIAEEKEAKQEAAV
jgi:hypothetical protein